MEADKYFEDVVAQMCTLWHQTYMCHHIFVSAPYKRLHLDKFLSSFNLEAPICGKCMQKTKSLDSTVDYEKICDKCGNRGVIYRKEMRHSCYFGFKRKEQQERLR
jgi:uncharacterized CHY-type Zn-finger protein